MGKWSQRGAKIKHSFTQTLTVKLEHVYVEEYCIEPQTKLMEMT